MTLIAIHPAPLFAAGFDWLEAILPLLFVGFWILSQVFAVFRRVAGGPVRPPVANRPVRQREAAGRLPPQPPEDARGELERQIAEFLREARADPKGAGRPQPSGARSRKAPPPSKPTVAGSVREVERTVGGLGVGPTDVARHVKDAFAHELSHLHSGLEAKSAEPPEGPRPAIPRAVHQDLLRTIRDPASFAQAVLLREILERPVDRW